MIFQLVKNTVYRRLRNLGCSSPFSRPPRASPLISASGSWRCVRTVSIPVITGLSLCRSVHCRSSSTDDFKRNLDLRLQIGGVGKESQLNCDKQVDIINKDCGYVLRQYGEDAAFVYSNGRFSVMGVADGVGGYRNSGIDPSAFSLALMKFSSHAAERLLESDKPPSCTKVLSRGLGDLEQSGWPAYGGSTAVIAIFDHLTGELRAANLGDSGLMVVRFPAGEVFVTDSQQHYFNCPYQLALLPKSNGATTESKDRPEHAQEYSFKLEPGDVFLIASDGYFDNMFAADTVELLQTFSFGQEGKYEKCFRTMLKTARDYSLDLNRDSPFALEHNKERQSTFRGGKEDDITLIMGVVHKSS